MLRNGAVRWKQAYSRFFPEAGWTSNDSAQERPTIDLAHQRAVLVPTDCRHADRRDTRYRLHVGKGKFPVGGIPYTAHRPHTMPASITLTIDAGRWCVASQRRAMELPAVTPEEIAAELATWSEADLRAAAVGVDRRR
ncbi:hypothetical protein ACU4GD_05190 [Cupriavidus basilensis]